MIHLQRPLLRTTVAHTGARAGSTLLGTGRANRGIRVQVLEDQPPGTDGPVIGAFVVLDPGQNRHSEALRPLTGTTTDAATVLTAQRRLSRLCVNAVNTNILAVDPEA